MNSLSIFASVYLCTVAPACQASNKLPAAEYPTNRDLCEEVAIEIKDSVAAGYLSPTHGQEIIDRCTDSWPVK